MKKKKVSSRMIAFFSPKCNQTMLVFSKAARKAAMMLEGDVRVQSYETQVPIAVRDSDNNLKEERHFNFSTESPMTRTNEAGEPEEIPAGERKIVGFVENTLECKYNAADEYSGYVETSNLGKTTLSRVSVDEDTGDSKWQLINREPGAQGDSGGVVTFERKGNRGKSETFYDVVKDLKNVNSFDEAALIDFRNKNRPKK